MKTLLLQKIPQCIRKKGEKIMGNLDTNILCNNNSNFELMKNEFIMNEHFIGYRKFCRRSVAKLWLEIKMK